MHVSPRFGGKEALDYNSGTTSSGILGVPGMAAPASSMIIRVAYGVTQLRRVAWYDGRVG